MDGHTGWPGETQGVAADRELSTDECWALLEAESVGRIAFVDADQVHVYPVNYTVHQGNIYFRTSPYGIVGASIRHQTAAFEVDHVDPQTRSGWAVLIRGDASWVVDGGHLDDLARAAADPEPWAAGSRTMYIRVRPKTVTGRRVGQP